MEIDKTEEWMEKRREEWRRELRDERTREKTFQKKIFIYHTSFLICKCTIFMTWIEHSRIFVFFTFLPYTQAQTNFPSKTNSNHTTDWADVFVYDCWAFKAWVLSPCTISSSCNTFTVPPQTQWRHHIEFAPEKMNL